MAVDSLPEHLRRYVVDQDYSRYTPIDQAVWRHIMRQLRAYLAVHAHPIYLEGLAKTGITLDEIPRIDAMNEKLERLGWRAVPVSGFIPPAAFMELQSLGILPIASDMRSVDHLLYTPAPDIVHEAAGHAPMLAEPAYAHYLKAYAQVARKAILSKEDIDQYEAIRILSDIKEDPDSTMSRVRQAEINLESVTASMTEPSEGGILGRMNWWTAEYGLIGDLQKPKIFGAGLLSSIGESRSALSDKVRKIPLSIECIDFAYDITEQQPQLFVARNFDNLQDVLEDLAGTMAFRRGGLESLDKMKRAQTVNTIELNSGLQISGVLKDIIVIEARAAYLQMTGPTMLSLGGKQMTDQGTAQHREGFGSPLGQVVIEGQDGKVSSNLALSELPESELHARGLRAGQSVTLKFTTGVLVSGLVEKIELGPRLKPVLISFRDAKASLGDQVLFDPSWGRYDMAIGEAVVSVYGGPADRENYGSTDDFTKKVVSRRTYADDVIARHGLYQDVRNLRGIKFDSSTSDKIATLADRAVSTAPNDWLVFTDLLEIAENARREDVRAKLIQHLTNLSARDEQTSSHIQDAKRTLHAR